MGNKEKGRPEYVERDLSWMYFNRRILQEAGKSSVPVLERMSFSAYTRTISMSSSVCAWRHSAA